VKPRGKQRRAKSSAAARLRPFWILFVLALIVVAAGLAFAVTWPGFDPKVIAVHGNRVVSRDQIVARARISMRVNMWLQNMTAAAARIDEIPYVKSAAIYRFPPGTVDVWITERTPFAIVRSGTERALVDRDLRVLGAAAGTHPSFTIEPGADLTPGTFLTGTQATALRDDYQALVAAHVIPTALSRDRFGGVVATLRGGVRVLLGDNTDLSGKIAMIDPILSQVARPRQVAEIDLRAPRAPVVVYR
jgi:cell division protein FtsQ